MNCQVPQGVAGVATSSTNVAADRQTDLMVRGRSRRAQSEFGGGSVCLLRLT